MSKADPSVWTVASIPYEPHPPLSDYAPPKDHSSKSLQRQRLLRSRSLAHITYREVSNPKGCIAAERADRERENGK